MIEFRVEPVIGAVALFTSCRELPGHVARVDCTFEVGGVAGIACGRHRLKLTVRRTFVAGVAVHGGMRPGQRKAIVVLLDLLDRHLPSAYCVTRLAICSQLPFVNIGVTVLAALARIGENRLDVTLRAGD